MLTELLFDQAWNALSLALVLSAAPLGASFVCGFLTAVCQAATQIQDQVLGFLPRLLTVVCVLWLLGPMLLEQFEDFISAIYSELAHVHSIAG